MVNGVNSFSKHPATSMYDRGQRSFPLFNVACVGRKDGRSDGLYYKMQILARFSKAAKDYIMYHTYFKIIIKLD